MMTTTSKFLSAGVLAGSILLSAVGTGWDRPAAAADQAANPLVGAWRLVSYSDTPEGGTSAHVFGREPIGLFIFTADGHMSASMMRNPPDARPTEPDQDPDQCIPEWYCSYFGTYTVDTVRGVWITHVIGGNLPVYLNTDQLRPFVIRGNRMIVAQTYREGGRVTYNERVFVRAD